MLYSTIILTMGVHIFDCFPKTVLKQCRPWSWSIITYIVLHYERADDDICVFLLFFFFFYTHFLGD